MWLNNIKMYDPLSAEPKPEVVDISVPTGGEQELDGSGLVAMPAFIEPHAHIVTSPDGEPINHADELLRQGYTHFQEAGLMQPSGMMLPIYHTELKLVRKIADMKHDGFNGLKFVGQDAVELFLNHYEDDGSPPPHIHLPLLGRQGGLQQLQQFLKKLSGRRCHLAHIAYYVYEEGKQLLPNIKLAAELLDSHKNISYDIGAVVFGKTFSLSQDKELLEHISAINKKPIKKESHGYHKLAYRFNKNCLVDSLFWLSGIELLLTIKDISRASLSIDYPSGGNLSGLPFIRACLMDKNLRDEFAKTLHEDAIRRSNLLNIKKELNLMEMATISSTAAAMALQLPKQGTINEEGGLLILKKQDDIEKMFNQPMMLVSNGEVIFSKI